MRLKVPAELSSSEVAALQPVELVEDGAEGDGHVAFDVLADALHRDFRFDALPEQSNELKFGVEGLLPLLLSLLFAADCGLMLLRFELAVPLLTAVAFPR